MEWILFTIGLLIGAIGGSLAVAIVSSGKMSDLDNEVISLRIQRNLIVLRFGRMIKAKKFESC